MYTTTATKISASEYKHLDTKAHETAHGVRRARSLTVCSGTFVCASVWAPYERFGITAIGIE